MRYLEISISLIMLTLAGFVIYATSGFAYWSRLVPGPGFMPYWVSLACGALALALLVSALRRPSDLVDWPERSSALRLVITYVALWAVVMLSAVTGFLAAIVVFMLFTLLIVFRRALVPSLVMTSIIAGMVHFLFNQWLDVRLPTGLLGF
jgi:putative tricarboxylic transport membrane protein